MSFEKFKFSDSNRVTIGHVADTVEHIGLTEMLQLQQAILQLGSAMQIANDFAGKEVIGIASVLKFLDNVTYSNKFLDCDTTPIMVALNSKMVLSFLQKCLVGNNHHHSLLGSSNMTMEHPPLYITDLVLYNEILKPNGFFTKVGVSYIRKKEQSTTNSANTTYAIGKGKYLVEGDSLPYTFDPEMLLAMCKDYVEQGYARTAMLKMLGGLIVDGFHTHMWVDRDSKTTKLIHEAGNEYITPANVEMLLSGILKIQNSSLGGRGNTTLKEPTITLTTNGYTSEHYAEEMIRILRRLYAYPTSHIGNNIITTYDNGSMKLKLPKEVVVELVEVITPILKEKE